MDWNDHKPNESFAGVLDDFDISRMEIYDEPRYLLHFQWEQQGLGEKKLLKCVGML